MTLNDCLAASAQALPDGFDWLQRAHPACWNDQPGQYLLTFTALATPPLLVLLHKDVVELRVATLLPTMFTPQSPHVVDPCFVGLRTASERFGQMTMVDKPPALLADVPRWTYTLLRTHAVRAYTVRQWIQVLTPNSATQSSFAVAGQWKMARHSPLSAKPPMEALITTLEQELLRHIQELAGSLCSIQNGRIRPFSVPKRSHTSPPLSAHQALARAQHLRTLIGWAKYAKAAWGLASP